MTDLSSPSARAALLDGLVAAAHEAGAEAVILKALARLAPGVPVVAEEEAAAGRIPDVADRFFLVDPLDGTKEFIKRGTDFTVNIALVENRVPTLGVVYAPARSQMFAGDVAAGGAWVGQIAPDAEGSPLRTPIAVRTPASPPVAVASKSHDTPATEAYLRACGVQERTSIGSSLKFCLVALGEADLYPRPAPTCEWDTGAGHAVLSAAGGRVFDLEGKPFRYGKPKFFNPGFVATGPYDPPPLAPFMPRDTDH